MATDLDSALAQLAAGKVVAAATESYFGLLADIENPIAVEALFALKPRGADKGVPTILPSRSAWPALVAGTIPSLAQAFADAHWPGGLSIALPAAPSVRSAHCTRRIARRAPAWCVPGGRAGASLRSSTQRDQRQLARRAARDAIVASRSGVSRGYCARCTVRGFGPKPRWRAVDRGTH